jgi:hypothetical protein
MISLRSSPDAEKMKKTVDDLDAWYRQHIQHNRKYSAPALSLASRRSESAFQHYWDRKGEMGVVGDCVRSGVSNLKKKKHTHTHKHQ